MVSRSRSGGINSTSGITFQRLNELKVTGTRTSLDGRTALMEMIAGDDNNGRQFKATLLFSGYHILGEESFTSSSITFDSTNKKFI
ncbi:MAG: hypothetical protein CM15mV25_0130 [uncultured marine virus]|nr:MAG: hypothetical protein CM15mV25_0130 [uncultured marine virus]